MVRKALIKDVPAVHSLINYYAQQQRMLPVAMSHLYERLRDFFVCEDDRTGEVIGCGALIITWSDLAEIRSIAVHEGYQRKGIGAAIVKSCLENAKSLGLQKVFVLTYETDFFCRQGFRQIAKDKLPHKIWSACLNCPKFPNCDETAMMTELK